MNLDTKLNFQKHLENIISKVYKTIGLLRKFQSVLSRPSLVLLYKTFIRPHINYEDIIYDQAYRESLHQKLEIIQYNAELAIISAMRGTSREKLYQELGLESLQKRRWYRKLCYFCKILKGQSPDYCSKILPRIRRAYNRRNADYVPCFSTKHSFLGNFFSHQFELNGII